MSARNVAASVQNAKETIQNSSRVLDNHTGSISGEWKGDIAEAYKNSSRVVRSNTYAMLNRFNNLGSSLNRLDSSVIRAIAEEEREAANRQLR